MCQKRELEAVPVPLALAHMGEGEFDRDAGIVPRRQLAAIISSCATFVAL